MQAPLARRSQLPALALVMTGLSMTACTASPPPTTATAPATGVTPFEAAPAPTAVVAPPAPPSAAASVFQAGRRSVDASAIVLAALPTAAAALAPALPVVEGLDHPAAGAVVVTFVGVRDGALTTRLAVGVVTDGAPRPVTSWPLALPEADAVGVLDVEPLDDPVVRDAVEAALHGTPLEGARLLEVAAATTSWPIVARLDDRGTPRTVWLRRVGHSLVLAGTPSADDAPSPDTTTTQTTTTTSTTDTSGRPDAQEGEAP